MKTVSIGKRLLGEGQPCYIIAEAGKNHNGDVELARELVRKAAEAGVDAVKFQSIDTGRLMIRSGLRPAYFDETVGSKETEFDITKRLELPDSAHPELADLARSLGIDFISTPEDAGHADLLCDLKVPLLKVSSLNIDNVPLLRHMASKGLPMVISTGMATLGEVEQALDVVLSNGCPGVVLLQCTSNYPALPEDVNLRAMVTMRQTFGVPTGFSDHTMDDTMALGAVALGASVYEKHFTLDRNMEGPDHRLSADPSEMKAIVERIRLLEKGLGNPIKKPTQTELEMKMFKRRSIVAARAVKQGTVLTADDLDCKCPGTGLSPRFFDILIGRKAQRDLPQDSILTWDDV
ncbi:MAG TPA: N-acetylneuraminate synthase family protein [bacterium]|nr:N-acetylneuraminate synthase family protein [bacterium]